MSDLEYVRLSSGAVLARNAIWNVVAQLAPMLVAIFSIPFLIRGLGVERFGVLALAWMVVGYFSVIDLGLGRGLTKLVAETLGKGEHRKIPELVWTGLFMMLLLGLLGAALVGLLSRWLVFDVLKIPPSLRIETLYSFYVLAGFIPLMIIIAGLRGILEAYQRSRLIATVSVPLGVYTYLGPLLVLPFSNHLAIVVAVLVAGRLVACLAYLRHCLKVVPGLAGRMRPRLDRIGRLLRFGGWITVTNIVAPFMVYLDRFLIGMLLSVAAVSYYVTPYDVVTRLWFVSTALTGVLFPAFSMTYHSDRQRLALLYAKGTKYLVMMMFPIVLCVVVFAHEGLDLWLGPDFSGHSERVLQWLAAGVFFSSVMGVASSLVQGMGRPDVQAKLNMMELPLYLLALWWIVPAYGVVGAAMAWTLRIVLDGLLMSWLLSRLAPAVARHVGAVALSALAALPVFFAAALLPGWGAKLLFLVGLLTLFISITWHKVLSSREREVMLVYARKLVPVELH